MLRRRVNRAEHPLKSISSPPLQEEEEWQALLDSVRQGESVGLEAAEEEGAGEAPSSSAAAGEPEEVATLRALRSSVHCSLAMQVDSVGRLVSDVSDLVSEATTAARAAQVWISDEGGLGCVWWERRDVAPWVGFSPCAVHLRALPSSAPVWSFQRCYLHHRRTLSLFTCASPPPKNPFTADDRASGAVPRVCAHGLPRAPHPGAGEGAAAPFRAGHRLANRTRCTLFTNTVPKTRSPTDARARLAALHKARSAAEPLLDPTTDPRSLPMPNERPTLTESQHQIKSLPRAEGHWGSIRSTLESSRPRRSPSRGAAVEEGTNALSLLGLGRGEGLERALARVALRVGEWDRYMREREGGGGAFGDPKQKRRIPSSQAPSHPSHARPVARILRHQLPGCARTWRPCCRGEKGAEGGDGYRLCSQRKIHIPPTRDAVPGPAASRPASRAQCNSISRALYKQDSTRLREGLTPSWRSSAPSWAS